VAIYFGIFGSIPGFAGFTAVERGFKAFSCIKPWVIDVMFVIAAFYEFMKLKAPESLRDKLKKNMSFMGIKGTVILAHEGINATVAGTRQSIDELQKLLRDEGFLNLEYKESFVDENPFKKLRVRFKKEIVTLGVAVDTKNAGIYVSPDQWNELLKDPKVICLDVRNDFEVKLGTFKNAVNPQCRVFSDFPSFVKNTLEKDTNKKIAMSCTGGIRCEKASALLLEMGFKEVFHLKGGILKYLEEMPKSESLWQGDCFVFDERIAVDHDLKPQSYENCPICHEPKAVLCSCFRIKT
jgi:UPF0176 protein